MGTAHHSITFMHKGTLMKNEIKCFGQVCFLAGALALANSPVFAAAPDRAALRQGM